MSNRLITIVVSIVFLIAVFVVISYVSTFWSGNDPEEIPAEFSLDSTEFPTDFESPTLSLQSTTGIVIVDNFLDDPDTKEDPVNPGQFQLGTFIDPAVDTQPQIPYSIQYFIDSQYFNVVLLQEPISEGRLLAEEFLIRQLNVSESELCSLQHMVSVPTRVNRFYAGQNLSFSFCLDSTRLE